MRQKQSQSTPRGWLISKKRGFSLVEAILAVSVFGMLVSILVGALLYGQDSTRVVGNRETALFLAEEALAAVRNIRDADYASLASGTYGLDHSSGEWQLSGSADTSGIYTRSVTISVVDESRKLVVAEVSWEEDRGGSRNVSLSTYLTNWQEEVPVEDCNSTCTALGYDGGICRESTEACSNNSETNLSSGNTYCTVEGINTCCCSGGPDTTAPMAVVDLNLENVSASSVDLFWTAPGDDVDIGTADSYDVRYADFLIDDTTWDSAITLSGEPAPAVASSSESLTISGLGVETSYYFAIKTSDEVPNISSLSNVVSTSTLPGPDLSAPSAISDLALLNEGTSSIELAWTAPGDDGGTGTATAYDIRYSNELITEDNWSLASQITGEPAPQVAGESESITVSSLTSSTTYYFAIKTEDEAGNISDISNVPTSATLIHVNSCETYCQSNSYVGGTCRTLTSECTANDEVYVTGGDEYCSAYCCCGPIEDVIAPDAITDMSYSNLSLNTFDLNFTAPGDNGSLGTVSSYQGRYSTGSAVTEETWDSAEVVTLTVSSYVEGGSSQTIAAEVSKYGTNMDIFLRAYDEMGNASPISNSVNLTTDTAGKVICTEAYRRGFLDKEMYGSDVEYAEKYANPAIMRGYHSWGKPVVRIVQHNLKLAKRVFPFTREWSQHSSYVLGKTDEDSPIGKMLIETAFPLCEELGEMMIADGQLDYEFDDYKVEAAMEKYYQDYYNMGLSDEELIPIIKKDFEMFMDLAKEVYLEDKANGFKEEREVYDDVWFVKLFKILKSSYEEVVNRLSHE